MLIIVIKLAKIVLYKSVKTIIDSTGLAIVMINIEERNYGIFMLIVSDKDLMSTLKFRSLLC